MQTNITITYQMLLTPAEFSLVSRALRRTLKDDQIEQAAILQQEMMEQKVSQMDHHMREVDKLRANLEKD